jgi:hypothetical protein
MRAFGRSFRRTFFAFAMVGLSYWSIWLLTKFSGYSQEAFSKVQNGWFRSAVLRPLNSTVFVRRVR